MSEHLGVLPDCESTRRVINEAADWVRGIDCVPEAEDPAYRQFELQAGEVWQSAVDAYNSRPEGCEMEMSGEDDCFACGRCKFDRSTDTSF